jgi:uncharacterized membrane-anchored protein
MLFGSGAFFKFIVLAVGAYWLAPKRHRAVVLLCFSLAYSASFRASGLLVVLCLVCTVTWYLTRVIHSTPDEKVRISDHREREDRAVVNG